MGLLNEFINYLKEANSPSKSTLKNYKADVRKFIEWFQEKFSTDFEPEEVSLETIEFFKTEKTDSAIGSPLSARSLDRHLSALRSFFNFLKLEGYISHSPFEQQLTASAEALAKADPYHLKDFKNYLYVYNSADLTIKNYIIDIKQFLHWAEEVTTSSAVWLLEEKNILPKINNSLVEEYKQRLITGFSPATVNRKLSSLRRYLAWAVEEGLIREEAEISNLVKKEEGEKIPNLEALKTFAQSQTLSSKSSDLSPKYSSFPPIRLAQMVSRAIDYAFETSIVSPLTEATKKTYRLVWKIRGKPIFKKVMSSELGTMGKKPKPITNLRKEFYSPTGISLRYLPWHKKAYHHIRYTRPNWYKKYHSYSITTYFHLSIFMIIMAALGFAFYTNFIAKPSEKPTLAVAGSPAQPLRIFSFQGRITDINDNPITSPTFLRFTLYDSLTATDPAHRLWEERDQVTPDVDGIFAVLLGSDGSGGNAALCNSGNPVLTPATGACGIPQAIIATQSAIWLGVTVGNTPELTPRQQLATVAYATNAELLQGMAPITQAAAGTSNVVLALDSSGNLTIGGSATPTFQASGGQFTISGQTLMLNTVAGSDSNIVLNPDGFGIIDLEKPLKNMSNSNNISTAIGSVEIDDLFSVLATSSGQSAVTINQTGGGPLISASASGTEKFTVDNSGNVTSGNVLSLSPDTYDLGASGNYWDTLYVNNIVGVSLGSGDSLWQLTTNSLAPINETYALNVGSTASTSAYFHAPGTNNQNAWFNLGTGNVGIGTTNPGEQLEIASDGGYNIGIFGQGVYGFGASQDQLPGLFFPSNDLTIGYDQLAGATDNGGSIYFIANDGGLTSGSGGSIDIRAGDAQGGDSNGGDVRIRAGGRSGAGLYGIASLFSGSGDVGINASDVDGLTLYGNSARNIRISDYTSGADAILDTSSLADTDKSFTFPNTTGTFALTSDLSGLSSPWILSDTDGTLYPGNSTVDLLVGGQSTASAMFGILNVAKNQPVASVSGNLTVMPWNGFGGNVGIGTTVPSAPLNLKTTTTDDLTLRFTNSSDSEFDIWIDQYGTAWLRSNGAGSKINLRAGAGGSVGITAGIPLNIYNGPSTENGSLQRDDDYFYIQGGSGANALYLGGSTNNDLTILAGGNVGIGTIGPDAKLDVLSAAGGTQLRLTSTDGSVYTDIKTDEEGNLSLSPTGLVATLSGTFNPDATNTYDLGSPSRIWNDLYIDDIYSSGQATFAPGDGRQLVIQQQSGAGSASYNTNNYHEFQTDSVERLVINDSLSYFTGNLGIGTIGPDAKLDVLSAAGGTQLRLTSTDGSVYTDIKTDEEGNLSLSPTGLVATFSATVNPNATSTYDLGSPSRVWNNLYVNNVYSGGQLFASYWQRNLGSLAPVNITDDLLVGGTSTPSAMFGILNVAKNQPVASVSGNLTVMPWNGFGGNVGIGTTGPASKLDIDTGSNSLGLRLRGTAETTEIGDIYMSAGGNLVISTANTGAANAYVDVDPEDDAYGLRVFDGSTGSTVYSNFYMNDAAIDYLNIVSGASNATTGLIVQTGGNVGIGTTSPISTLDIRGNLGTGSVASVSGNTSFAAFVVDNNSLVGDLITASSAATPSLGRTQLRLTGNGKLYTRSYYDLDNSTYFIDLAATGTSLITVGSVGINTTAPSEKLDINGNATASGNLVLATGDTTIRTIQTTRNNTLQIGGDTTGNLKLVANNTAGGVIQLGTGGAGSTTPDLLGLDVKSTTGDPTLGFEGAMYYNTFDNKFRCYQNAAWADCIGGTSSSGGGFWQELAGALSPTNVKADLLIGGTATASSTLAFSVTNVGISQPVASVSGKLIVMPNDGWGGNVGIGATNPSARLEIRRPDTTTENAIRLSTTSDYDWKIYQPTGTSDLRFWTDNGNANRVTFETGGNVGIGTTAPSSRLHVVGSSSVATVGVSNELTADGTFATSTGWTNLDGTKWSRTSPVADKANHPTGQTDALSGTSTATTTWVVYQVNFTVAVTTAGTGFTVSLGGKDSGNTYTTAGAKATYIQPSNGTGTLSFTPGSGGTFEGTIDDVTIYAVSTSTPDIAVTSSNGTSSPLEIRAGGSALYNVYIGTDTGYNTTTGYENTAIGYSALADNTTGYYNTAMGAQALGRNTTGQDNTAIGTYSLNSNTAGYQNTVIGSAALSGNTNGWGNDALGHSALNLNTTGFQNTALGRYSLSSNTTGYHNTALSNQALGSNITGSENVSLGYKSMFNSESGWDNTIIGYKAGYGVASNSYDYNTLIGYQSGYALTTGSSNILLGYKAGDNLTSGGSNLLLGYNIDAPTATTSNFMSIGNLIFAAGGFGTGTAVGAGNIGIGITAPTALLDIAGNASSSGVLTFRGTTDPKINILNNENFGIRMSPGGDTGLVEKMAIYSSGYTEFFSQRSNNSMKMGRNGNEYLELSHDDTSAYIESVQDEDAPGYGNLIFVVDDDGTADGYFAFQNKSGTDFMRIDDVGNVGIGTTDPGVKLDISGTDNTLLQISSNNTVGTSIQLNNSSAGAHDYQLYVTGSSGSVVGVSGIWDATTNNTPLAVYGGTSETAGQYITTSANGVIGWSNNTGTAGVPDTGLSRGAANKIYIGNGAQGDISGTLIAGTVGIGITSPLTALDIAGSASLSANLSLRGAATTHTFNILDNGTLNIQRSPGGDAGLATAMFIQNNGYVGIGTTDPDSVLHIKAPSSWQSELKISQQDGGHTFTLGYNASSQLGFTGTHNSGSYPVLFDLNSNFAFMDGNVGIGTTAPGYGLQVGTTASPQSIAASSFIDLDNTSYLLDPAATGTSLATVGSVGIGTSSPLTSSALDIQKYTSANAMVVLNQLSGGGGDFITASAAGVTQFRVRSDGDVIVGPNGDGKLTAYELDPLYTIDGTRYSTYGVSMVGIKEEVASKAALLYDPVKQAYSYKVELNNQPEGSDLWLFSRITDPNVSLTTVLLTPESFANTWYEKDVQSRTITLYSDSPTFVSYRLTAPRFDAASRGNLSDETEITGVVVPGMEELLQEQMAATLSAQPSSPSETFSIVSSLNEFGEKIYSLVDSFGNIIKRTGNFSDLLVANIEAGFASISDLTVRSINLTTDNLTIGGQSIRSYIAAIVEDVISDEQVVSPLAEVGSIHTNIISPLSEDSKIAVKLEKNKLEILNSNNSSGSAVATIDNLGNASFAGQLTSNALNTNQASVAGTLRAGKIIAEQIEGLNVSASTVSANYITNNYNYYNSTSSAGTDLSFADPEESSGYVDIASFSGKLAYVENFHSDFLQANQGLMVFGPTSLSDVSIIGQLAIGGQMILADNSINVLGGDLQLQPLRQGGINFLSGLFTIDSQGNIVAEGKALFNNDVAVKGDALFGKDVWVRGKLAAGIISPLADGDLAIVLGNNSSETNYDSKFVILNSSGSAALTVNQQGDIVASGTATFSKLNLSLASPAYAVSQIEVIATGSAGMTSIKPYQNEITIKNSLVTESSLIYITPRINTANNVLFLLRQTPEDKTSNEIEGSFTVGINQFQAIETPFNWIIIN